MVVILHQLSKRLNNFRADVVLGIPATLWTHCCEYVNAAHLPPRLAIDIAAQDIHGPELVGPYTGEVGIEMLKDCGVKWAIVGHSERRSIFGDTDSLVQKKVLSASHHGIQVIVNVGEKLDDRDHGRAMEVVGKQLGVVLQDVTDFSLVVIAYEPVWAIGTGRFASASEAQEMLGFIRKWIAENRGNAASIVVRILYTGSVNASNCQELLAGCPDCDGFVVGGASLRPEFGVIISSAARCKAV
ncbi:triose phosphate isomerase [Cladochytrium replicatum]|nr:triose phosphate isomerase [Cladochytrium replicatum]